MVYLNKKATKYSDSKKVNKPDLYCGYLNRICIE